MSSAAITGTALQEAIEENRVPVCQVMAVLGAVVEGGMIPPFSTNRFVEIEILCSPCTHWSSSQFLHRVELNQGTICS
jgi:hypothetical protein